MKKLYLLLSILFLSTTVNAQNPDAFIMTFEITDDANSSIIVPIVQNDDNNYTVDFGDGTILTNQTGNVSHTYSAVGTYTVSLTGTFKHIKFYDIPPFYYSLKLKTIEQWGTNQWASMENAFFGSIYLILNATDTPDLSQVTDMSNMFGYVAYFNQPLNNWDVSNVTNMAGLFLAANSFNQPLDSWDVSNVTNMRLMFSGAFDFNQPIDNWDVSNVTDMEGMFSEAYSFNQDISEWNFNSSVSFTFNGNFEDYYGFVSNSGLNITNYDLLLQRFATLELQNKTFYAAGLEYCNSDIHSYLINSLGWTITEDSLAETEECSLNINSLETDTFISIYPNPTNGILHISSKGNTILEEVKIYNLQGRELFNSLQNLETIRIEDLSSGIYLMNIKTNQGTISKRVIKK